MGKVKTTIGAATGVGSSDQPGIAESASNVTPITAARNKAAEDQVGSDVGGDQKSAPAAEPALIVFGRDEAKKPHASWFGAADAELAEKAAGLMRFKVLRVTSNEHRAAASKLPAGRIFASGKGFVPFAKEAAHEALCAFDDVFEPPAPPEPAPEPALTVTGVPSAWSDIRQGSLVLASADADDGWWPAIIVEARGDDLFVLAWEGWPSEAPIVRRGADLGLMPPSGASPVGGDQAANM